MKVNRQESVEVEDEFVGLQEDDEFN